MDVNHKKIIEDMFSRLSFQLTKSGKISPLFMMILPDNSVLPIMMNYKDLDIMTYASVSIQAADEMNATALILVCEQYMIKRKKDDPVLSQILSGEISASCCDDKENYLTIIYTDNLGKSESLVSKIECDPVGTKYTLDFHWLDYSITNLVTSWK
jgi:hypothetical protein